MNRWQELATATLLSLCACSDAESTEEEAPPPMELAAGVRIGEVALYQGVEILLARGGETLPITTPILAGRDATVRVFVSFDPGHLGALLRARLWLGEDLVAEADLTPSSASSRASLASTFNLFVPGSVLDGALDWHVEIIAPDGPSSVDARDARFPPQAKASATAEPTRALEVLLVPLAYVADGSGREPDTSPEQIALYREYLLATYPVSDVAIEVSESTLATPVMDSDGAGWDEMLDTLYIERANLGVTDETLVYGLVNPAGSWDAYCGNNPDCVEGISFLDDLNDPRSRVGFGLGFTGLRSAETAAHELAHELGRDHAPCGVFEWDPAFPDPGGLIGTWGLFATRGLLYPPETFDFMSYCEPIWISPYTYTGILERVRALSPMNWMTPREHRLVHVGADGALTARGTVTMPAVTGATTVRGRLAGADVVLEGHMLRYSHLDGGLLITR